MGIRVLIADDQPLIRTGSRIILEGEPDIDVVGEAADGEAAVSQAAQLRPDVALVDINMPGLDGIEATRLLAGRSVDNPIRVVIVTTYDTDENVYTALRAGAVGFLLKDAGPGLLVHAVRTAYRGDGLITPSVLTRLLQHWSGGSPQRADESLTPRELDIVQAVARGMTNAELGDELAISISTVKTHLAAVQRKIGARNRTEIAIWAWEKRLVR